MTPSSWGEGWLTGIALKEDMFTIFLQFGMKCAEPETCFLRSFGTENRGCKSWRMKERCQCFFMNDQSAVTPNANYCGFQLTRDCACSKILNKWISFYLKLFIGTNWE